MKTVLLLVGKTTDKHFQAGMADYESRIVHYMPFSVVVIPEIKNTRSLSSEQQKQKEGELILKSLSPSDTLILLDEKGLEFTSVDFASWLTKQQQGSRRLVFCIGGPYGFSSDIYDRANGKISLSKMTFSHQMVRVIFLEQFYRACTIMNNEPYHHD